jgi:RHS repeat-associated protein
VRYKTVYDGAGRVVAEYVCYLDDEEEEQSLSATEYVYDAMGRLTETKVGAEIGSTETVSITYYDTDHGGENGDDEEYRVTWVASVMASDDEEDLALTQYVYDPDTYRLTTVISPDPDGDVEEGNPSIKTVTVYDDLGRAEEVQTLHDTTQISKVVRTYDGTRLDTVKQYGSSTDYLTTTYDYDGLGRNIKVTQPSGAFTKTKYDLMGRTVATYLGTEAGSETGDFETALADDTIIEQTEYEYDPEAPRVWLTAHYQRHPDDTGENATPGALAYNTSRANYVVTWFDGLGRTKKTVNYGTYDGAQLDSQTSDDLDPDTGGDQYYAGGGPTPNSPTAGGSKLCIVTTTAYDGFGRAYLTTDNAGREMKILFDDAGRKEYIVEHYVNFAVNSQHVVSGVGGTNNDEDRVTQFTYNKLGLLEKQIALNATSSLDQETRYIYAFEMGIDGCEIPRPELLLAVIYPDSDDTISGALGAGQLAAGNDQVVDRVSYTYYCNGALKTASDQRGVVHTYSYDFLNRLTDDAATTCPSGVDGTVIKIRRAYDNNGRLDKVTSLGASDVVRNEIEYTYNAWGEVTKSEQSHAGAVGSAPSVEYGYDTAYHSSPNAKYVRLRSVTYPGPSTPNRRAVYYNYETVGEFAPLNRVAGISNAATSPTETYAAYSYLGAGAVVKVEYPEVEVSSNKLAMKYWSSGSTYPGLDSMGRVIDQKWAIDTTVKDQFKYAYDGSSNRLSRDVAPDMGTPPTGLDHYYTYDGLDRLTKSNRGTLVDGTIADGSAAFNQAWPGLDALGNWTQFKWDTNGGGNSWTEQSRAHNKANEIAGNSGNPIYGNNADWIDPAYDLAGNMIAGPKPGAETTTSQLYIYDAWNRLVEVQDSSENIVAQYRYDGRHQRIRKYVAAGEDWTVTEYYYNGNWQVIETRQAEEVERTGTPILEEPAVSSTVHEQYVWGIQYIDAPIVRFRDADTLYYTYDAQFNVTALVGTDGVVKERYAYDPYGKVTVLNGASDGDGNEWTVDTNGSDYDNQILYCGYRYDPESGLYHVRYRYYHPTLGRWTTRDPAGYVDGANLYEYVRSNPIGYLDWEGLQTGVSIGPAGTSSADKIFDSLSGLSDEELANKIAGGGATAAATEAIGNLRSTIAGQGSVKIVSRSTEGTILESSESNPELRAEWYKNVMAGTGMKDAIKHRYVQSVASGVDIHIDGGQVQRDSDESVHYVVGKEPQMNLSKSGTMNATLFGPETNGFFIRYDMSIRSALSEGKTSKRGESGACVEVKGFKFAVQDEMKEGVDFDYGVNAGIGKISLKTGRVTTTVSTVGPVGFYIRSNMDLFSSDEEWKAAMPKGAKISYYVEMFLGADGQQFIKAGDFPYTSNWGWQGKDPITGAKWYRAQEQNTTLTTQWIQMKGETSYAVDNWNSVQQRNGNR